MNYKTIATKFAGTRQELLKLLGFAGPETKETVSTQEDQKVAELNAVAKDLDKKVVVYKRGMSTIKVTSE